MTTTAGDQKVTATEAAFTTYQNQEKKSSTPASAITKDEPVLVLGWTSGSAITATQVVLHPTGLSASSSAAQFTCGGKTVTKQVGQIPPGRRNTQQHRDAPMAEYQGFLSRRPSPVDRHTPNLLASPARI
jgi:hypothetical protein